ncbi:MAG: hypothetical protein ACRCYY_05110 [Trueperaceae bacterium]
MVLIGSLGIFLSAYSFWITGKLETPWLRTFLTAFCGFMFAGALLWVGYGFQRGEIIYNRSVELPVWIIGR